MALNKCTLFIVTNYVKLHVNGCAEKQFLIIVYGVISRFYVKFA